MTYFLIAIALLVALILMGIPVAYSMGVSSVLYVLLVNPSYLQVLPLRAMGGVNQFILLTIPFFILAAEIMVKTDLSRKLFALARLVVGKHRGGLAFVNIVASTIFGSISGSAIADVSGLGVIEIEEMTKAGYDKDFSIALTAASALQSPLIPPSTTAMVYAGVMGISTGAILMAGIGPGLLIALTQFIYILLIRKKRNFPKDNMVCSAPERKKILIDGAITMMLPVIILGGILGGFATATEAAAIAVVYSLFLGFVVYKNLNFKSFKGVLWNSCKTVGNLFMIIAFANSFAWVAGMEKIPDQIAAALLNISENPFVLLMIVNVFYVLVGMLMDTGAAIILFAPILGPVMAAVGVHPVHFAAVTIVNLTIGLLTPPVGLVLFTAVNVGKRPFEKVLRAFMPFIVVDFILLLVITLFPELTIAIPRLMGFIA